MKAKRLVFVVLAMFIVALLSGVVSAAEHKIGHLSKLNISAEEVQKISQEKATQLQQCFMTRLRLWLWL